MIRQPVRRLLLLVCRTDQREAAAGWPYAWRAAGASGLEGQRRWRCDHGEGEAPKSAKPLQCQVLQAIRGHEIRLQVTGRSARDFVLRREVSARREQPASASASGGPAGGSSGAEAGEERVSWREHVYRRVSSQVESTFLPAGYPHTVGPRYLDFAVWQAVTNVAATANGVLASTFLLYSVGLGAGAIPTAGALNWVLKDGLGQVGTLLFGKAIAHNFDIHSKSWYFLSCAMLCMATGLEILTIVLPNYFLALGSLANMIKGLSWMAGGSTRSVFNLSFVRDNNIADITAKGTSQYIFASLFGTAAGVSICAYIGQSPGLALLAFGTLTWAAMYSSFRSVKTIPLPTLNGLRLQLLTERYLRCIARSEDIYPRQHLFVNYQKEYEVLEDESACDLQLPSPLELAAADPPLPWLLGDTRVLNPHIGVGPHLAKLVHGQPSLLVVLLTTFKYSRYMVVPTKSAIHLLLHRDANARDIVQAYLQACILRKRLKAGMPMELSNLAELRIVLHDTLLTSEKLTNPFMLALQRRGWLTEKIVVEAERRRAVW